MNSKIELIKTQIKVLKLALSTKPEDIEFKDRYIQIVIESLDQEIKDILKIEGFHKKIDEILKGETNGN